jgi:hypothetical protein
MTLTAEGVTLAGAASAWALCDFYPLNPNEKCSPSARACRWSDPWGSPASAKLSVT